MLVSIDLVEVFDEGVACPFFFVLKFGQPFLVIRLLDFFQAKDSFQVSRQPSPEGPVFEAREVFWVEMPERPQVLSGRIPRMNKVVNKSCANSDFNAFDGIQDHHAQLAVEIIASPDCVEGGSGLKEIRCLTANIDDAKGIKIPAQPIVVYSLETCDEFITIREEATSNELVGLLLDR